MRPPEPCTLHYANLSLDLLAPPDLIQRLRLELEPFFVFSEGESASPEPFATLRVHRDTPSRDMLPSGDPTEVDVDTSLYKHLASKGRRWGSDSKFAVLIEVTQTWTFFEKLTRTVDLYQPDASLCVIDTVRSIKSLFTPALELSGGLQLHSSAVTRDSGCVLILADMWHGKTTLLLEMLAEFNVGQLSCDTVVLATGADGNILVSGWPSPFSVSHGTMADFPQLYPYFPRERASANYEQLWREGRKAVLSSADVVRAFNTAIVPLATRLDVCILARFAPAEPSGIERVEDPETLTGFLRTVCLGSRDPIYHNWHRFIVCPPEVLDASIERWAVRLLTGAEVYRMTWAPSAVSMMKRIPKIARMDKYLPRILDFPGAG